MADELRAELVRRREEACRHQTIMEHKEAHNVISMEIEDEDHAKLGPEVRGVLGLSSMPLTLKGKGKRPALRPQEKGDPKN
jgi:hypothetical protein